MRGIDTSTFGRQAEMTGFKRLGQVSDSIERLFKLKF